MGLPHICGPRWELVEPTCEDVSFLCELGHDVEVMRHLPGGLQSQDQTREEWRLRLERRTDVGRGLGYGSGSVEGEAVG